MVVACQHQYGAPVRSGCAPADDEAFPRSGYRRHVGQPVRQGEERVMGFVAHSGLGVSDLVRSARFYCELLGFSPDRELAMTADQVTDFLQLDPPGDMEAAYLYLGDFQLELLKFDPAGGDHVRARKMNEVGLTHISIAVDSVPDVLARVAEFGGEIVSALGDKAAMIRDPDGQLTEILEATYAAGERVSGRYGEAVAKWIEQRQAGGGPAA
jgi:catechol 2,3-dioxygenase-like lactoylglutathione lyase family enzyme